MLIYVIPLVILVIVLVILNKRQKDQESDKATKPVKAKKTGTSAKAAPKKTHAVDNTVIEKKKMTELTADTRSRIEKLIAERNFFSAEAQINQSLKKDNSQHELYLYLLDIHILQKDEFAISQLLSHIRSLELDDILAQAEVKKAEYEGNKEQKDDSINYVSPVVEETTQSTSAKNTADFDALMETTTAPPAPENKVEEIKPLDFNFSSVPKVQSEVVEKPTQVEDIKPLEFESFTTQDKPVIPEPAPQVTPTETAVEEIKPLDFNMDFAPSTSAKTQPVEVLEATADKIEPLDFSFTTDVPKTEGAKVEEPTLSFDLTGFDTAKQEEQPSTALDFKLDTIPSVEEKPAVAPSTGLSFDISGVNAPVVASTTDQNDPLVQSFPELLEVNEAQLNIELAEQYVKLGAYQAARDVLAEKEAEFSTEQRQQAEQLLNQIAS